MGTANQITDWASLVVIFVALLFSVTRKSPKHLFPIQLYILTSFIFNTLAKISDVLPSNSFNSSFGEIALNINSIFEILFINIFLYTRIKSTYLKLSILFFFFIYISTCCLSWIFKKNSFFTFTPDLFGFESLLITLACFFYISEILKRDSDLNLKTDTDFIITCGILFYFSISIPSFFSWYNLIAMAPEVQSLLLLSNSIFYAILFISFMKAYLCIIQEKKQLSI
jgi:hypothetical protein